MCTLPDTGQSVESFGGKCTCDGCGTITKSEWLDELKTAN